MENHSLIEILQYERNKLTNIISTVFNKDSKAQITSKMNIKEILGQINWYENRLLLTMKAEKKPENQFNHLSTDEKNDQISLIYKNFTFDQLKNNLTILLIK